MAQKTKVRNDNSIFWSNIAKSSSDEDSDAYIPGLSSKGNRRPGRLKGRKTTEVKAQVPLKQPLTLLETVVNDLPERDTEKKIRKNSTTSRLKPRKPQMSHRASTSTERHDTKSANQTRLSSAAFQSFAERSIHRLKEASLKDLRPEDKQRVANLIKELARVGDEKEKAVQELHGEREHYEKQLITMVEQQEKILNEREDIQDKLFQCQKLLTEYQAQLLNKQDRINDSIAEIQQEVVVSQSSSDRKSRSRVPAHRLSANQKHSHELWTNQNGDDNDSVSDLLLNSKDPRDNVKRPFTSLIDKEIAKERSLSRGSQRSDISGRSQGSDSRSERSRSRSPSEGRPKFAYPEKLISLGPLHEPIASSTHKSMEIKAQMSNNFDLESVRSSIQGQGQRYESKGNKSADCHAQNDKQNSKVVFSGKDEYDDEGEIHSPNLKATSKLFNDPEYAVYYKKLSPGGRKRELLKQRQALLMEQENLKGILEKQERQLKERQYEYTKRQELQKERMEFYQKGGKFPAFKLNFDEDEAENGENPGAKNRNEASDGEIDEDEDFEELERGSEGGYVRKEDQGTFEKYSPQRNLEIDEEVQIQSRISAGASPMTTPTKVKVVTKVTSPATSQESEVRSQRSVRSTLGSGRSDTGSGAPRGVDAATSISYRTPLKDATSRQGNLTLGVNRHRSSPLHSKYSPRSESLPSSSLPSSRVPGEKTLNVLEIVNSMDEGPSTPIQRQFEELENFPSNITPTRGGTKKTVASSRPPRQYSTKLLDDSEESAEESKILEDIFFL
ncbi:protein hinderin-like isoform X2 [Mya arenaria]|uniref:protein hinderin-like isoform X2 n=1 Tax=Mya arenaria TaxID=6604 RepID=UPI0022E21DB6|nr:protein hinderin-like isoform X2 [Mya arenaria]